MYSYWERKYWFSDYDFTIVGSGIVGLSCAIRLKQSYPKSRIAILERANIPKGASTKNAGFACFGTVGELLDDLSTQSSDELIQTIRMRWEGLRCLRDLVPDDKMNYIVRGGFEMIKDKDEYDQYSSNIQLINAMFEEATGEKDLIEIRDQEFSKAFFDKCFYNRFEAQLNPVSMLTSLIKTAKTAGIDMINSFELSHYETGKDIVLESSDGLKLRTRKLVFCTNAFTTKLFPDLDIIPARNQVIVTEKIQDLKYKGCFHFDKGYVYFRDVDGRILLGGARNLDHETEKTSDFGKNEAILQYLNSFLIRLGVDPDVKIEFNWSGIIATGSSKSPIVMEVDKNVYAAVRLGGMGVAIGSGLAIKLIEIMK